jgi:acyl dehydratase
MALNPDAVGTTWTTHDIHWSSKDALLYALGVGAGQGDPTKDLAFTTENSHDVAQRVLPTFAAVAATLNGPGGTGPDLGDFPLEAVLHGEQSIRLYGELPCEARATIESTVEAMYDKGRDALVVLGAVCSDAVSGAKLFSTRTGVYVRGEGGFGGERGSSARWAVPETAPDEVVHLPSRPEQALFYRLSGDRNPLHSDPWFAKKAGFDRPILHGLCTFGITGRGLVQSLCDGDPARFGSMEVRFSAPTYPGRDLHLELWRQSDQVLFRTKDEENVVLDRGRFRWADHA